MNTVFTKPHLTGKELNNLAYSYMGKTLAEGGSFSLLCEKQLEKMFESTRAAILTQSIGASFELAADLLNIIPGDEIILPSFTYVSAANAFARRGATLCFTDVQRSGLNICAEEIKGKITHRTRAVVVPHYAGMPSDVAKIVSTIAGTEIVIIEDISQAFLTTLDNRLLGTFGSMACASFHESEGVHAGEGGALLINDHKFIADAEILKYRGTNKASFARGDIDHYGWERIGGEYCANELTAAFLYAQLGSASETHSELNRIWRYYSDNWRKIDTQRVLEIPQTPTGARLSGNFYVVLPEAINRAELISDLLRVGIECRGHFYPLHLTNAGKRYGKINSHLSITEGIHNKIVRLPSYFGISEEEQNRVMKLLLRFVENKLPLKKS